MNPAASSIQPSTLMTDSHQPPLTSARLSLHTYLQRWYERRAASKVLTNHPKSFRNSGLVLLDTGEAFSSCLRLLISRFDCFIFDWHASDRNSFSNAPRIATYSIACCRLPGRLSHVTDCASLRYVSLYVTLRRRSHTRPRFVQTPQRRNASFVARKASLQEKLRPLVGCTRLRRIDFGL